MTKIGVARLCPTNRAAAERLRLAGFRLLGYDTDLESAVASGIRTTGSLSALMTQTQAALIGGSPEEALGIARELLQSASAGAALILTSRVPQVAVRELAEEAAGKGVAMLDAPLSLERLGGSIFVGGDQRSFDHWGELFQALGRPLFMGEAGSGQAASAIDCVLFWANSVAGYEAFTLAAELGLDLGRLREGLATSHGGSRAIERWGSRPLSAAPGEIAEGLESGAILQVSLNQLSALPAAFAAMSAERFDNLFNAGVADLRAPATAPMEPAEAPEETLPSPS